MKNLIIHPVKKILSFACLFIAINAKAQYYYANDKDNTRPEVVRFFTTPPSIQSFNAISNNGYNEIQWMARQTSETRRFVVEYSTDGVFYQSAGEGLLTNGIYSLKHQTFEIMPMLYRIRTENMDGKHYYSSNFLLQGIDLNPVKIYPTQVTGNMVNVNAAFAVERVTVFNSSGQQVFSQDMGGRRDQLNVQIPALPAGIYFMHFWGTGWKATERFMI